MAHPYTTETRLKRPVAGKSERLLSLLDRNRDGVADSDGTWSVLEDAMERVANLIDGRLGMVYSVPFASATAASTNGYAVTYGLVSDLCDLGVKALLYAELDPGCDEATKAEERFDDMLADILAGTVIIPGATKVDAGTGRRSFAFESLGTEYAGGVTGGLRDAAYDTETGGGTSDPTRVL